MVVETQEIETSAVALATEVDEIMVRNADEYEFAGTIVVKLKAHQKGVKALFKPHKQNADGVHAALCADERKHLQRSENIEKILKERMVTWKQAEEARIAEERQAAELVAQLTTRMTKMR